MVFKLSSLAVTRVDGGVHHLQMNQIINDIMHLKNNFGIKPVIVTSGAINAGRGYINSVSGDDMPSLQACSSVGQLQLMKHYLKKFEAFNQTIAQILLTHEDLKNKKRSLNTKNTLNKLLDEDIIPILNENDTVSFDEITFGDNDQLSAMTCEMINADYLLLLTEANGLYDRDPADKAAKRFKQIQCDDDFENIITKSLSSVGKGGMKTKLQAVRKLTPLGIEVFISTFKGHEPILRALDRTNGTQFLASTKTESMRKKSWLLTHVKAHASVSIDLGAKNALLKNASLLPVGIRSTSGPFMRGDSIQIKYGRSIIGYGITEYSSKEVEKIKQLKSSELHTELAHVHSAVVIHKDNLLLK